MSTILPTIIICERHWDLTPKEVVKELLPKLAEKGYDTFCVEAPASLESEEIIKCNLSGIQSDSELQQQAESLLRRAKAMPFCPLEDVGFGTLCSLMREWVSSRHYEEVAYKIKNLPAAKMIKNIFSDMSELSISIRGVDIEGNAYDILTTGNVKERTTRVIAADDIRTNCFDGELLKLRKSRRGIVFLCGATHITKLMDRFKARQALDNFIFYFPHSTRRFDDSLDDIKGLKETFPELADCAASLTTPAEVTQFAERVLVDVTNKKIEIITEQTASTQILNKIFNLPFLACKRPDFYVDGLLELDDPKVNVDSLRKELSSKNIEIHLTEFLGKKFLVVPNINTEKVARPLKDLWLEKGRFNG